MNDLKRFFKIWSKGFSLSMSSELAYRTSFVLMALSLIFSRMIGPIITILVYNVSQGIPGWTLMELILLQGVAILVFGFGHAFVGGIAWYTQDLVEEGELENVLLRPFYVLANIASRAVDFHGLADVFTGLALIIFAVIKLNLLNGMIFPFIILILLALIFMTSINIFIAGLSIIFVRVEAFDNIIGSLGQFAGWPITVYPGGIKFLLTFLIPVAIASYWPASILIGKEPLSSIAIAIIPVLVFFVFSIWFWGVALKKYQSAGG